MQDDPLPTLATDVLAACRRAGLTVAVAESCTGGLIAAALTAVPGSSDVVDRGFVTYSNAAKNEMLGVPAALIATHGAVSAEVAQAMASGALAHSNAGLAVAVTGIAVLGTSINNVTKELPAFKSNLDDRIAKTMEWLEKKGFDGNNSANDYNSW